MAGPGLRGNGDGWVDVDELFDYTAAQTGKFVLHHFSDAQTPVMFGERAGPIDLTPVGPQRADNR